jgi:23S rRNA (uridine2552-2'-O)-methyltransferase
VKPNPRQDYYARRAREEQYPARSVYKLEEIQKRFGVLKSASRVLDLGCCPGSWLLFASKVVGDRGLVFGVDITPLTIRLPSNVRFIQQDVLAWDESFLEAIGANFQTVLSDMAPSTTESKFVDSQRSLELSESALAISARVSLSVRFSRGPTSNAFQIGSEDPLVALHTSSQNRAERQAKKSMLWDMGRRKRRYSVGQ